MRRYSMLHPLLLAFYSRDLYRDVARHWRGVGFSYLLVLMSLCTIPGVMQLHASLAAFLASEAPKIVRQIPVMTISKGRLSVDKPVPYFIRDEASGKPLIIIDTGGTYKSLDSTSAVMLFTARQILVRQDGSGVRALDLADLGDLVIDRRIVFSWLDDIESAFPFVVYPVALFLSALFYLAQSFFFGAGGLWAAHLTGISLPLQASVRMSAVAVTPAVISGTVLSSLGIHRGFWWLAGLIITMAYVIHGIKAQSGDSQGLDRDHDSSV